jgi:translation initiation factor 1 (eIF-1/SUI1)
LEAFGKFSRFCASPYLAFNFLIPRAQDIELKKAAKLFAQKFATGSSVTKNPQGLDEIVVQGDVSHDIMDMIEEKEGFLKAVPKDNVILVEEKKKKGGD